MFPLACSAKLETIYRLKMSKTSNFATLSIKTFYMHVYVLWLVATLKGEVGQPSSKVGGGQMQPSAPPLNAPLY